MLYAILQCLDVIWDFFVQIIRCEKSLTANLHIYLYFECELLLLAMINYLITN